MPQKRTGAVRRRQPRNKKTLSAVISAVLVLAAVLVYYFPELETYLTGVPNTDSSAPAQPTQSTDAAADIPWMPDVRLLRQAPAVPNIFYPKKCSMMDLF